MQTAKELDQNTIGNKVQYSGTFTDVHMAVSGVRMSSMTDNDKFENIICETEKETGFTRNQLFTRTHRLGRTTPCQMIIYLVRLNTQISLTELGKRIKGRNHTSIYYAFKHFRDLLDTNDKTATELLNRVVGRLKYSFDVSTGSASNPERNRENLFNSE